MRPRILASLLYTVLLTITLAGFQSPPPPGPAAPLSVEDVVKLCQTGISEELIITKIKKNGRAFDLSNGELVELKKAGVSDNVVKYLLDPSQPYIPPPPPPSPAGPPGSPPKPPVPAKKYPADAYAAKVPADPGLYYFSNDAPVKIDVKMLLGETQGGGKMFKKKRRVVGYLVGPASRCRFSNPAPVFYLRLPEGKGIEEVVLVVLEAKGARREIEEGSADTEELKPTAIRQFDPLEVGPQLYRLTPAKLDMGEYLFFLVGSAEAAKGNYGKGYDFGIDPSAPKSSPK